MRLSYGCEIELYNNILTLLVNRIVIRERGVEITAIDLPNTIRLGINKIYEYLETDKIIQIIIQQKLPELYRQFITNLKAKMDNTDDTIAQAAINKILLYAEKIQILNPDDLKFSPKDIPAEPLLQRFLAGKTLSRVMLETTILSVDHVPNGAAIPELIMKPIGKYKHAHPFLAYPNYLYLFFRFATHFAVFLPDICQTTGLDFQMTHSALSAHNVDITLYGKLEVTRNGPPMAGLQINTVIDLPWFAPLRLKSNDQVLRLLNLSYAFSTDPDSGLQYMHGKKLEMLIPVPHFDWVLLVYTRSLIQYLSGKMNLKQYENDRPLNWLQGAFGLGIWTVFVLCAGGRFPGTLYKNLYCLFPKTDPRTSLIAAFLNHTEYYMHFLAIFAQFIFGKLTDFKTLESIFLQNLDPLAKTADEKIAIAHCVLKSTSNIPRIRHRIALQLEKTPDSIEIEPQYLSAEILSFAMLLSALPDYGRNFLRSLDLKGYRAEKLQELVQLVRSFGTGFTRIKASAQSSGYGKNKFELRQIVLNLLLDVNIEYCREIISIMNGVFTSSVSTDELAGDGDHSDGSSKFEALSDASSHSPVGDASYIWMPDGKKHPK